MADNAELLAAGMKLLQYGAFGRAEQTFANILAIDREHIRARLALGIACYQQGKLADAERHLQDTLARNPTTLPAYNNLSLVYKALGAPAKAIAVLRTALTMAPGYVDARYNLALLLEETGDKVAAIDVYRQVIQQQPEYLRAHSNVGLLLRARNEFTAALPHLDFVARREPQAVSAWVNLALVLTDLGRYSEAVRASERATQLDANNFDAWEACGNAQRLGGDASAAVLSLKRAHGLNPAAVEVQYELGLSEAAAGEFAAARTTFNIVAGLRPDWLKVLFSRDLALPLVYSNDEHIRESLAGWDAGLASIEARLQDGKHWSEAVAAVSGYVPFYLHYQGVDNTGLQCRFGDVVETVAKRAWPQYAEPVNWRAGLHGARLRVGFVSAFLRRHSVGHFFGAWISQLDHAKFKSFVWYTGEQSDAVTQQIRSRAAHFSHAPFDVGALAKAIHGSHLDVLIYLDLGLHPHAQVLAGLRLAPVQCTTFGHPVTSGLSSIDYFLSADSAEPAEADSHYRERLIRLPRFAVNYARPDVPRLRLPAVLANHPRPFIFCPQPIFKLLPHFDRLITRIARELPGCRIAFMQSMWPTANSAFLARISAALKTASVDAGRTLVMLPIMPYDEYLGTLQAADVVLDSSGFSGGNSSFDAINVGAAIVTHRGTMLRARQTAALLDIVGLGEFASGRDEDYVASSIAIASDETMRREARERMRVGSKAVFDDDGAVRGLEATLLRLIGNS